MALPAFVWVDQPANRSVPGSLPAQEITGNPLAASTTIAYKMILQDLVPGSADQCAAAAWAVSGLSLFVKDISHVAILNARRKRNLTSALYRRFRGSRRVHHFEVRMKGGKV